MTRGRHHLRTGQGLRTPVGDLLARHDWHLPGNTLLLRSLRSVDSLQAHVTRSRLPCVAERAALNIAHTTQMAALYGLIGGAR